MVCVAEYRPPPPNGPLGRNQGASDESSCCDAYGQCRSGRIVQIRQNGAMRLEIVHFPILRWVAQFPRRRRNNRNRGTYALDRRRRPASGELGRVFRLATVLPWRHYSSLLTTVQ